MKITYDKIADALYIYLKKSKVSETMQVNADTFIDIDKYGKLLGIEILNASHQIPKEKLLKTTTSTI
ncbi:MAG: DUF2283 domain-containing protein [Candidatus Pacebacteria bacterium]|nr:DUF2283 domain-containing protein [Candidatus Paceibacterota bacterium]MCF7862635.1 DUF2283 domain-containing protein [Candidatus Paceibacterota bacterium]